MKEYPDKVKVAIKQYPLAMHKMAPLASEAVLAANEQGRFKEMHDLILKNYRTLDRKKIEGFAASIGLNVDKFKKALDDQTFKAQVAKDMKDATTLGIRGAPASFINGYYLSGAQPYEVFKRKVEAELKQ